MIESLLDNIPDVIVGKLVENVFTNLTVFNESVLSQYLELMRYRGLSHTESNSNIANAHWRTVYNKKYAESRRVTENLEKVGEIIKLRCLGQ